MRYNVSFKEKKMDTMSSRISANLKKIRNEKKLSLDSVANMTGVSKSMLGQIERGESSPTVATLWKIATGLHISFTALLESESMEIEMVYKKDIHALLSDKGHFRLFPFFPYDDTRRFEILQIEMDIGSYSASNPHEEGTEELLLISQGTVRITVGEQQYIVEAGNGIRYFANQPHVYENVGDCMANIYMVIFYKK